MQDSPVQRPPSEQIPLTLACIKTTCDLIAMDPDANSWLIPMVEDLGKELAILREKLRLDICAVFYEVK